MKTRIIQLVFVILAYSITGYSEVEQPQPMPNTYVHDFAGVIAEDKRAEIQAKATRLKNEFQTEIAVVMVESLQGEDSFNYSMRMARTWGIGSKDNEIRGLLILVATKDRKTSFRTSRHIEGTLPDGITGDISRQMNAYFKDGDFGGGLSIGLDRIIQRLSVANDAPATLSSSAESSGGLGLWWLLIIALPMAGGIIVLFVWRMVNTGREAKASTRATPTNKRAGVTNPTRSTKRPTKRPTKRSKPSRRSSDEDRRPSYDPSPSSIWDSSSSSSSSSSSYDSGSSSSYSGGSDYGGGGSDSSW